MVLRRLVAAAILGAAASPLWAQTVRAGIDAWQRADYSAAVAIWRPLAERGDADAAFNLGQAYRLGRGVQTNLALAKAWFERAANKGHIDAQTTLGLLLFQSGDQAAGLKWLKTAAEQGEPRALLVYGTALFNGDGVTQNPVLGYAYVSWAAAQGFGPARETLGDLDKLMSVQDRKKGLELAMSKAKTAPRPVLQSKATPIAGRPAKPQKVAPAKPAQVAIAKPVTKPAAKPAPASPMSPAPAASGAWRIQLGAFNNRASAEAGYRKLAGNAALGGRSPQYIPFNQFIRLRVGPFASKESAAAACSAVRVACFPVAPGK
jgi:cell division septation protein DedD